MRRNPNSRYGEEKGTEKGPVFGSAQTLLKKPAPASVDGEGKSFGHRPKTKDIIDNKAARANDDLLETVCV